MRRIIVIGTLHAGLTPHDELQKTLETYQPEQLLVEIGQSDIDKNTLQKYPDEMCFALDWAKKNGIPVFGFDAPIDVLAPGKTENDNQIVIKEQMELLKHYTWKDANASAVCKKLNTPRAKELVDKTKEKEREKKMLENIKKILLTGKQAVILTGVGHLDFFERHFPEAVFPFR